MFFYKLKPFSPHLLIYSPQVYSSLFSIFHRVSSLFLLYFFFLQIIFFYFSLNIYFIKCIITLKFIYFLILFFNFILFKIGLFHILNGLRMILWNFNYLNKKNLLYFSNKLVIILFLIKLY